MKTTIFSFLVLLLLSAAPLHAQFRVGAKGGVNLSNINMNINSVNLDNYNPRVGIHAGLMAEYMFIPRLGLQTELVWFYSGATIHPENHRKWFDFSDDISFTGYIHLHTLRLPLYLKTKLPITSRCKLYVMGGGFATFSASAYQHLKLTNDQRETLNIEWNLFDDEVRILDEAGDNLFMQERWNYGITAEAGIEISNRITAGFGFAHVLNNMSALGYRYGSNIFSSKIRMWTATLSVGYFF